MKFPHVTTTDSKITIHTAPGRAEELELDEARRRRDEAQRLRDQLDAAIGRVEASAAALERDEWIPVDADPADFD